MVGRPRKFERENALAKARDAFWERGYEATSVQDLIDAMGINRGSMYSTFGDKHALFLQAFEDYGETVNSRIRDTLNGPGSPRGNIDTVLRRLVSEMLDTDGRVCRGCLITNTAVELAPHHEDIARAVRDLLGRTTDAFQSCLDRAAGIGEVPAALDTRAAARHLTAVMQGLIVMGKSGVSKACVEDIVDAALASLN